jgi:hypothetical protein
VVCINDGSIALGAGGMDLAGLSFHVPVNGLSAANKLSDIDKTVINTLSSRMVSSIETAYPDATKPFPWALTPLPHLFPCLDKLLNRPRTREMAWADSTDEVHTPVEILDSRLTHHRKAEL